MKRIISGRLAFAVLLSVLVTTSASECFGHWGSRSHGSSGGSSGISYGSSGGRSVTFRTPVRTGLYNLAHRGRYHRYGSSGSSGYSMVRYYHSNGSSGGSSGHRIYYRGGSSGSRVIYYHGSSGGGNSGYMPVAPVAPSSQEEPKAAEPKTPTIPAPKAEKASNLLSKGILTVAVPESTKIYVNDNLTKTKGSVRRYRTPEIENGQALTYEVKAVYEKDGAELTQTKIVDLNGGDSKHLEFIFETSPPPVTQLSLRVPKDAEVNLAGNLTKTKGAMRLFTTTSLKEGESWEDYQVTVVNVVDGRRVVRTKKIKVIAGETMDLNFDFDSVSGKIAAR
jgi:uncharacterized protein (TIGR03000 family)